jgi:hypothetical protein
VMTTQLLSPDTAVCGLFETVLPITEFSARALVFGRSGEGGVMVLLSRLRRRRAA